MTQPALVFRSALVAVAARLCPRGRPPKPAATPPIPARGLAPPPPPGLVLPPLPLRPPRTAAHIRPRRALAAVSPPLRPVGPGGGAPNIPAGGRAFPAGGRWTARVEAFCHDPLPSRDTLLAAHARLKVGLLGASSTPRVRLGEGGWL